MSLQFILGNSGTGKTTFLYKKILTEASAAPKKNFLVIVPEQFTMQTQKKLVELSPNKAIMNIDVLSFERLAYRIFDELGIASLLVLEDTGKNLAIRKVALDCEDKLTVLRRSMNKIGYVDEVKSFITELIQYNISPKDLKTYIDDARVSDTLRNKLSDILVIYEGFEKFKKDKYITAEETLAVLRTVANRSKILKDSVIAFDEFTGFTPVQNELLKKLFKLSKKIYVTLSIDSKEDMYQSKGMHELFDMPKKTIKSLSLMANDLGVEIEDAIILKENFRLKKSPQLLFMEQNLFRRKQEKWNLNQVSEDKQNIIVSDLQVASCENEQRNSASDLQAYSNENIVFKSIHIDSVQNPIQELTLAARRINDLVRNNGLRYKDIAVVTGDVSTYAGYVEGIFGKYNIPYFVDTVQELLLHPFIEFIRSIPDIAVYDFSTESVMRFLRCGFCDIDSYDLDCFENYLIALGIRGKSKWKKKWEKYPKNYSDSYDLDKINEIRERIYDLLVDAISKMTSKKSVVRDYVLAIYEIIESLDVYSKLSKKENEFLENGQQVKAKQYSQIYTIVMQLFEKYEKLLGDEQISIEEFVEILDAGLDGTDVAAIPPGYDTVTIGDIERTRLSDIKVMFFIGVNDGVIPKTAGGGGIISQFERQCLVDMDVTLAPSEREQSFMQRYYLYLCMTKPSEEIYLSYYKNDSSGKSASPSYIINLLLKMFDGLCIDDNDEKSVYDDVSTKEAAVDYLITYEPFADDEDASDKDTNDKDANDKDANDKDANDKDENDKNVNDKDANDKDVEDENTHKINNKWFDTAYALKLSGFDLDKIVNAKFERYVEDPITENIARAVYGDQAKGSTTRFELFAKCAYSHFLKYALRLREREEYGFSSMDIGTIYHDALEGYGKNVKVIKSTWSDISDADRDRLAIDAFRKAASDFVNGQMNMTETTRHQLKRMEKVFLRTVWALTEQVKAGSFVPTEFEIPLEDVLDLNDDKNIKITGRIDRIDTYQEDGREFIKIIDYKSGMAKFDLQKAYYGTQMQLPVYLNSTMKKHKESDPKISVEPGAMFYYRIDDPEIDEENPEKFDNASPELTKEINDKLLKELKPDGIFNSEETVYRALDRDFSGSSFVMEAYVNKEGVLKKSSHHASRDELETLCEFTEGKLKDIGQKIYSGNISINPVKMGDTDSCKYCKFNSVCRIDSKLPKFEKKKVQKLNNEEIFEKMKTEIAIDRSK